MRFRVLCVGKLKEGFYRDACHEFCKRLSRYAQVEILEVPDEKARNSFPQPSAAR